MMWQGLIVAVVFTAIFMRVVHGWLTSKTDEIRPGGSGEPKA